MNATTATKFHIIPSYAPSNAMVVWTIPGDEYFGKVALVGANLSPEQGGFNWVADDNRSVEIFGISLASVNRILPFPGQSFPECVLILTHSGVLFVVDPNTGTDQQYFAINVGSGPANVSAVSLSEINGDQVALFALEAGRVHSGLRANTAGIYPVSVPGTTWEAKP